MKISTENPSITIEKNWEEKYKNPFTVKEPYTAVEKKITKEKKKIRQPQQRPPFQQRNWTLQWPELTSEKRLRRAALSSSTLRAASDWRSRQIQFD